MKPSAGHAARGPVTCLTSDRQFPAPRLRERGRSTPEQSHLLAYTDPMLRPAVIIGPDDGAPYDEDVTRP